MQARSRRTIGTTVFLFGLLVGLGLAGAASWSDYEAMSYFYSGASYEGFGGLSCPIFMSRAEQASIAATFQNASGAEIQPYYEAEMSGASEGRTLQNQIVVPGHASRTVYWTVNSNDIDLGSFVMIKLDVLPVAGHSTREATCGILVLDTVRLRGGEVFALALAASLTGMVLGLGLRESAGEAAIGKELNMQNGLRAAGVATALAMLTGFAGAWLIGVVFCAMSILLVFILLRLAAV